MNWWFKGRFLYVLLVAGAIVAITITEDMMHLGLFSWVEQQFGALGVLAYIFFWAFLFAGALRFISQRIARR